MLTLIIMFKDYIKELVILIQKFVNTSVNLLLIFLMFSTFIVLYSFLCGPDFLLCLEREPLFHLSAALLGLF